MPPGTLRQWGWQGSSDLKSHGGREQTMLGHVNNTIITACVVLFLSVAAFAGERWSEKRAAEWYAPQSWLAGCNYTPRTAINQLEFWQADTFDPKTIDQELAWAQGIGFNVLRVYLHDIPYRQDAEGFCKRIDEFLSICDKHGIRAMFVLLDDCWDPSPKPGKQPEPRPHVHNSGWVQCPGNEITARLGLWAGDWSDPNKMSPINKISVEQSDIVTFHCYDGMRNFQARAEAAMRYNRPTICTEYLNRRSGCTFQAVMPYMKEKRIGAINWGFVAGKIQTQYPWSSWHKTFTAEPPVWFHDILRPDGKPFDPAETDLIRKLTGH